MGVHSFLGTSTGSQSWCSSTHFSSLCDAFAFVKVVLGQVRDLIFIKLARDVVHVHAEAATLQETC